VPSSLRTAAKRVARAIARSPLLWSTIGAGLVRLGDLMRRNRDTTVAKQTALLRSWPPLAELRVLEGPFKGLRYPSERTFGSTLYPKLVGSYECEIVPWLRRLQSRQYAVVHDIGCAEGYYAVGLALLFPSARVCAYDTDLDAREACRRTAVLNGVADRVMIGGSLASDDLLRLPPRERALILCDCEGCELHLFTADVVRHLAGCDLIIELHDFIDPTISRALRERFAETHQVAVVPTHPRDPARYPVLRSLPALARRIALDEMRPGPMEWLLAESRVGT
jgi:hypothetical protein